MTRSEILALLCRAGAQLAAAIAVVALGVAIAAASPASAQTPPALPPQDGPAYACERVSRLDLERQLQQLHNRERAARGLPRLETSWGLKRAARAWSTVMGQDDWQRHQSQARRDRIARETGWAFGENVGHRYRVDVGHDGRGCWQETVRSMHRAYMDSPGHRANLLRRDGARFGVGIRRVDGKLWTTVLVAVR